MASKPLGSRSTALEALGGCDLSGKVAVVTGGNSGIGVETVRALAHAGADVVLCSRSVEAGQRVADELQPGVKGKISVRPLDLADLASVAALGADLAASLPRLDLLICNAGVMACPKALTKDGFELQIATSYFGHFRLAQLLLPQLKQAGKGARVVVVSSSAHSRGRIVLEDLNFERRTYDKWASYGQAKLACILYTKELARRLAEEGSEVKAFSLHPGVIQTNLYRHMGGFASGLLNLVGGLFMKSIPQGAATTIYAATAAELEAHSGAYLVDCKVAKPSKAGQDGEMAKALWLKTEELLAAAAARAGQA